MRINYNNDKLGFFKHPLMGISFPVWLRLLYDQGFKISWTSIPKVILITIVSILNIPLQLLEYAIYSRRIKKQEVREPVFIIGHPRSGTTHLHYLMSKDKRFAYCTIHQGILPHTFIVGGKLLKKMIAKSLPDTRPQDNVRITVDSPQEEEFAIATMSGVSYMNTFFFPKNAEKNFEESVLFTNDRKKRIWKRAFKYYLQKLSYAKGEKQLLLKSPANTGRIKEILEVFPDAKFIHIHRNSIEVFQSTVKLYEKVVPLTCFHKTEDASMEEFVIDAYRKLFEKFQEDCKALKDSQLCDVSYSELLAHPLVELKRIYEAIGLNSFQNAEASFISELKKAKDYQKNSYPKMDAELEKRLLKEWGDVLRS